MVQSTSLSGEYLGRSKWANSSRVRTEIRIVSFVETTPATDVTFFQGEGGHGLSIGSLGESGQVANVQNVWLVISLSRTVSKELTMGQD